MREEPDEWEPLPESLVVGWDAARTPNDNSVPLHDISKRGGYYLGSDTLTGAYVNG